MQITLRTRAELWNFNEALKATANQYFNVPSGELSEAVAVGFGKRSQASLIASLKEGSRTQPFDLVDFVAKLSELVDEETAEALGAMLDGVELDVEIVKYSEQQMRSRALSDVAYTTSVIVRAPNLNDDTTEQSAKFLLPEFTSPHGEPFRVDSAHTHRHSDSFAVSRAADPRSPTVACLRDLRWDGGLFVYSPRHQADDTNCLKSVKAAMARRILPAVTPRASCLIYKPDHYDERARRIEVSVGQMYRRLLNGSELQFDIPRLAQRMVRMDEGYMGSDVHVGRLVDGHWFGDVYSNGISEAENPSTLKAFRAALLAALHSKIRHYDSAASQLRPDQANAIKRR